QAQQRRLAAAGRPEHRHQLAAPEVEVHLLDGVDRPERLRDAVEADVAHAGTPSRSTSAQLPAPWAASSSAPRRPDSLIIRATGTSPTSTIRRAGSAAVSNSDSVVACQTATASVSPSSGRSSSVAG